MNNKKIHMMAFLLVIVGALNWGLVGIADFDLVMWLFADILSMEMLARIVYILVGLAAVYEVVTHKASCIHCGARGEVKQSAPSAGGSDMPGAM